MPRLAARTILGLTTIWIFVLPADIKEFLTNVPIVEILKS